MWQSDLLCSWHSTLTHLVITMTPSFPDEETGCREKLSHFPEVTADEEQSQDLSWGVWLQSLPLTAVPCPALLSFIKCFAKVEDLGSSEHWACLSQSLINCDLRVRAIMSSLSNHILTTALRSLFYPSFADEDAEDQRGEVICLGSYSGKKWSRASSPRPPIPHLVFVLRPQAASQVLWDSSFHR